MYRKLFYNWLKFQEFLTLNWKHIFNSTLKIVFVIYFTVHGLQFIPKLQIFRFELNENDDTALIPSDIEHDRELSEEQSRLLDLGREDTNTSVTVTVTVHTTPEFRCLFQQHYLSSFSAPKCYVEVFCNQSFSIYFFAHKRGGKRLS